MCDGAQAFSMRTLTECEILSIYTGVAREHFPKEELKPVAIIERMLLEGGFEGLGLFLQKDGAAALKLIGYALFVKTPGSEVLLLDYYAVLAEYRNSGMGSYFLTKMKAFFGDKPAILLETEAPDCARSKEEYELRVHRNGFYQRNGAVMTGVMSNLYGVEFGILCIPLKEQFADEQVYTELQEIYRYMLGEALYGQNAKVSLKF